MPVSETLPTLERVQCAICATPMPPAKPGAGKPKLYCADACKQASYRLRQGQDVAYYQQVSAVSETPLCARERCRNPAQQGKRGYKMYCSPACKQKAIRERHFDASRRQIGPTAQGVSETLPSSPPEVPNTKRRPPRRQTKEPADDLRYWRKGRGVVHVGVQPGVTFCGRATADMIEQAAVGDARLCQRCQETRDNQAW